MNDLLQPLIHKAEVRELAVHVGRTGLSIGDRAELVALDDGRVGVVARVRRRFLGLIPGTRAVLIGTLGPEGSRLVGPAVGRAEPLRVRIVGLTPEHLAEAGRGPEVHVSVWGDARAVVTPAGSAPAAPATRATEPGPDAPRPAPRGRATDGAGES